MRLPQIQNFLVTYGQYGDFAVRISDIESAAVTNSGDTRIQLRTGRVFYSREALNTILERLPL